ncbi:uncharacterized protein HMPREF1541_04966 [Cyphellophora europaea CBS 101466]|uniref:DNA/RNA-binding domain-containing protein n=1 Tax=Cyphellophora europaea (strain CBS 101466) TaxID=1220924 RepID=W2RW61_CYPE1|nr:uncharacterized protein HMPREF1541_04966 [Cyphellophora europaea CBS 101466]ETN40687.1 hypothetical protein HMPREF1541_04966 [Cyphellophora europaea CBS 101466]
MEEHVKKTSQKVDRAERDLAALTQSKDLVYTSLEPTLAKFRDVSLDLFFQDIKVATSKDVETRLWAGHVKVNVSFRTYLASLRREENRKKTVERRKAEKMYLDFIKSSQRFYRGFIQRICSHFGNLGEIYSIASKMHLDITSVDAPIEASADQKRQLVRSCHTALIQCGDLSRYREIELNQKERNWGPAKGYYECAAELDPTSGRSFNQLSVMALADGDHFRALFYLYRCLAMPASFENAPGNLLTEVKKLRNKSLSPASLETKLGDSEIPFLKFHGQCYASNGFPSSEAEEVGLLSRLSQVVTSQPCNASLRKLCLINIAASKHARECARNPPLLKETITPEQYAETWRLLQSLNLSTFTTFLRLFSDQLKPIALEVGRLPGPSESIARLTPVCRRLLPCLRLYSGWLLADLPLLLTYEASGTDVGLKAFWPAYADALSYLSELFPVSTFLNIPYLLEEEQDTLHFNPFEDVTRKFLHMNDQGVLKPYRGQCNAPLVPDAQRPDTEMLFRIKGLLKVGIHLVKNQLEFGPSQVPLIFKDNQFEYQSSPEALNTSSDGLGADTAGAQVYANDALLSPISRVGHTDPENIENMVDDLVGPEPASTRGRPDSRMNSSGILDGSSKESSRPTSGILTASDLVRQISQGSPAGNFSTPVHQSSHRASFGLYQTPFAPMPGEFGSSVTGSRPGTAHQTTSPRVGHFGSSASFQDDITKRQKAIEARSSPIMSLEPSGVSSTPTGFYTFAQDRSRASLQQDQWPSPLSASAAASDFVVRKAHSPSKFGAIGDSRPKMAKAPRSGQPG